MPDFVHAVLLGLAALALAVLTGMLLFGCTAMEQGPPIELADVAVPKVAEKTPPVVQPLSDTVPLPAASPSLLVPRGGFQAWIPRRIMPNGDVHEGHYVTVSDQAPQKELTKPEYEIPKAPKQIYRPPPKNAAPGGQSAPAVAPPPPPPALPPYQGPLSPGFSLPQEGAHGLP